MSLPPKLGNRALVAQTCKTCGLLLDASWYKFRSRRSKRDRSQASGGGATACWTMVCNRCFYLRWQRGHRAALENQRKLNAHRLELRQQYQNVSLVTATRNGYPWAGSDHETLSDPDLTLLEKAVALHRTYFAVMNATARFGYESKVGRGTEEGQWVITFPVAS